MSRGGSLYQLAVFVLVGVFAVVIIPQLVAAQPGDERARALYALLVAHYGGKIHRIGSELLADLHEILGICHIGVDIVEPCVLHEGSGAHGFYRVERCCFAVTEVEKLEHLLLGQKVARVHHVFDRGL